MSEESTESVVRERKIVHVTLVGLIANLVLTLGKFLAGLLGHSAAMVTDAAHSLSDLITDFIVLAFVHISAKGKDKDHDFGHGKFETFATLIIGVLLFVVGAVLLASGANGIYRFFKGETLKTPGMIALWAAVISIVVKEGLYQYTVYVGKKVKSPAVIANAWHHRSDALSSIGSLLGIGGAILLGSRFTFLDPLAACVISILLMVVSIRIALPAVKELLDVSLPDEMENEIIAVAESVPGVIDAHELKTLRNGTSIVIETHITVDSLISVVEAHNIASSVEDALKARFGAETQVSVHIEPDTPESKVSE